MTAPAPPLASSRALVWSYSALSAFMAAGYGALFTVVGDYRDNYGISEATIGWIIGIGFIAAFVAQILIAPVGDRGHARTLVLTGVGLNAAGLVLMGLGRDGLTIMAGRILTGLAIGTAEPAIRRIVSVNDPANLGRNMGRLLAANVFGFAAGPAISALLVPWFGLPSPFLVIAACSLVLLVATLGVRPVEVAEPTRQRLALDLLRIRPFAGAVALGAGAYTMIGAFDALWDLVHTDLNTVPWLANLGITLFALPLIVLAPIGGRLAQELNPFLLSTAGLVAAVGFMTAYGAVPDGNWMFGVAMFHAVSDGFTIGASGVAVGLTVPEERQSGAYGVLGAAQALAAGLTAAGVGALYQSSGRMAAYGVAAAVILALAVGGYVLAGAPRHLGGSTLVVLIALTGLAVGCGAADDDGAAPSGPTVAPAALDGVFALTGWEQEGREVAIVDPTELVIDTRFGGLAVETGCGVQLGSFSLLDDGRAGFTVAGGRSRDCSAAAADQQDRLLAALARAERWTESDGLLTLVTDEGDVLTLERR